MTTAVIGFAGMTHLGINSAVAAAEKGFDVVCFDNDSAVIAALQAGQLPVAEPQLPELLKKNAQRIRYSAAASSLSSCTVVYIAPDVTTDDAGRSDLSRIDALIPLVDAAMAADAVMVVLSQVPPGFTRARARAGRRLYYQVETLIFGRAVERALYPERFIVGCAEPDLPLPLALEQFLGSFSCPVLPMRYESAELAKISINMCLVASVGVANIMAELCEHTGADWSEIIPALKLDRRIGPYSYLSAGLGIAGGNLERDLATVLSLAQKNRTDAGIVSAWLANSEYRKDWTWRTLSKLVLAKQPDAKIAVLGLAYKEDTHSIKNSPALALLSHLDASVAMVYDPVVSPIAAGVKHAMATSALEAVRHADAVCIMTPWAEFKALSPVTLAAQMRGRWLIDPFRLIDGDAARRAGLHHVTLGIAPEIETPPC